MPNLEERCDSRPLARFEQDAYFAVPSLSRCNYFVYEEALRTQCAWNATLALHRRDSEDHTADVIRVVSGSGR